MVQTDPIQALIDQGHRDRKIIRVGGVMATVLIALFGTISILSMSTSNRSSDIQASLNCRSKISGAYNDLVRDSNVLVSELQRQFDRALISSSGGRQPSDDDLKNFFDTDNELSISIDKIKKLPDVSKAYAHGVTVEGVRYEACPG